MTKPKQRATFTAAICDGRPGIDAKALDAELLRIAAELASKPDAATAHDLQELDAGQIVRPERIITPTCRRWRSRRWLTGAGGRWVSGCSTCDGRTGSANGGPSGSSSTCPAAGGCGFTRRRQNPRPTRRRVGLPTGGRSGCADPRRRTRRTCSSGCANGWPISSTCPGTRARHHGDAGLLVDSDLRIFGAWDAVPVSVHWRPIGQRQEPSFRHPAAGDIPAPRVKQHDRGGPVSDATRQRWYAAIGRSGAAETNAKPGRSEILSMLLAGYRRGGTATRLEAVGDSSRRWPLTFSDPRPWLVSRDCPRPWQAELSR
jgi:hypothetical protein